MFLTSSTTAAASEMLINCLRPYMTVITIGTTTKGRNRSNRKFPQQSILMGAFALLYAKYSIQKVRRTTPKVSHRIMQSVN